MTKRLAIRIESVFVPSAEKIVSWPAKPYSNDVSEAAAVNVAPPLRLNREWSTDVSEAGGPLIVSQSPNTPEECLQILNAAWVCPVAAFKIEFEDGTVHDSNGTYISEICKEHG